MKTAVAWLAPLLAIVAVILAIALGNNGWVAIPYKGDVAVEAAKVAGALFVVALFLERGLAVVNDLLFGEQTVDAVNKLQVAAQASAFNAADTGVTAARWELNALEETKQRVRLGVGFIAAVLIAAAGVRTFTGLLDLSRIIGNQRTLLDTMDVLLTAGLLAGGSNGLAVLIDVLLKRAQAAKERALAHRAGLTSEAAAYPADRMVRAGLVPNKASPAAGLVQRTGEPAAADRQSDDAEAFQEWSQVEGSKGNTLVFARASKWRVARSLLTLRDQLNASYPNRNTASDGTIGDDAHCGGGGTSDHCPNVMDDNIGVVTAFDATHDPASGCDMNKVVEAVRASKDARIKYVIWNKRICSSYAVGNAKAWDWRAYTGSNPHDKHAHFSVLPEKPRYDDSTNWSIS